LYLVFPFHEQLLLAIGTPGVVLINLLLVGSLTLPALACARYDIGRRSRPIGHLQPAA
jgi:hypothetical protein